MSCSRLRTYWRALLALTAALGSLLVLCSAAASAATAPSTAGTDVGGVVLRYLPPGLGAASDFRYSFDDVDMASRVWESPRPGGGWRVDLDVTVMRGERLADGRSLREWFIAYEQRDPAVHYRRVRVHGRPGWLCADQLFWLVRPGAAVSVHYDGTRWSRRIVVRTAESADTSKLGRG